MSTLADKLTKSKLQIVTRNGKRYYANGKNAGKEVGTVRGKSNKVSTNQSAARELMDTPVNQDVDTFNPESQELVSKRTGLVEKNHVVPVGKKSDIPFVLKSSPSTNLIGNVAFGKASKEMQAKLNGILNDANTVINSMGISMIKPIDFVCGEMDKQKRVSASFTSLSNLFVANDRIDLQSKDTVTHALMHEIGHAIDFSLGDKTKYISESSDYINELTNVLTQSPYFKNSGKSYQKYLKQPTEIFARCFEIYSYSKAKDLVAEGKIDKSFLDNYSPDFYQPISGDLSLTRPDVKHFELRIVKLIENILKNNDFKKGLFMKSNDGQIHYVCVVPIKDGQVLLGERREDKIWTTVAGGIESGEYPLQAAVRELYEEAGIVVETKDLTEMGVDDTPNGKRIQKYVLDLDGKMVRPTSKQDPDEEVSVWGWFYPSELPEFTGKPQQDNRLKTIYQAVKFYMQMKQGEVIANDLGYKLTKARTITIGGQQYYSEGKNAGKLVGSVRRKIKVAGTDKLAEKEIKINNESQGSYRSQILEHKGSDKAKEYAKRDVENMKNSPKPNLTKSIIENLAKAKIKTINGVSRYADGKHAGKVVGTVRQATTKLANGNLEHQIAVLDNEIKNNVADGKIITAERKIKKIRELKAALKGELAAKNEVVLNSSGNLVVGSYSQYSDPRVQTAISRIKEAIDNGTKNRFYVVDTDGTIVAGQTSKETALKYVKDDRMLIDVTKLVEAKEGPKLKDMVDPKAKEEKEHTKLKRTLRTIVSLQDAIARPSNQNDNYANVQRASELNKLKAQFKSIVEYSEFDAIKKLNLDNILDAVKRKRSNPIKLR